MNFLQTSSQAYQFGKRSISIKIISKKKTGKVRFSDLVHVDFRHARETLPTESISDVPQSGCGVTCPSDEGPLVRRY